MRNRAPAPGRTQLVDLVDQVDHELGDPSPAVRMAGVEALARLADTSPVHRRACVRVLCAALRQPYDSADPAPGEPHLRQLMLDVIRDRLKNPDAETSWHGLNLDLSGVALGDADLSGLRLVGGSLRLSRSEVAGALDLTGIRIEGNGALLFDRSVITGQVLLDRMTLTDGQVLFDHATLDGGELSIEQAELTGGHLMVTEAQLGSGRVSLTGAKIDGTVVTFHGSTLNGADLLLDTASLTAGRCYLTSLMLTAGSISFRDARIVRSLLSLRMSTLAGGRFDLTGVTPLPGAEAQDGPDSFEGVYLIPPVQVDWGPWPEAAGTTLDLREEVDSGTEPA
jgi:uncharacterized protein YjbI with pentapeptide repeats